MAGWDIFEQVNQVDAKRDDIHERYNAALDNIRKNQPVTNTSVIDELNVAHDFFSEDELLREKRSQLEQNRQQLLEKEYKGAPSYGDIFGYGVYKKGMDYGLGAEELYREYQAEKNPSEESLKSLEDFRTKQVAVNSRMENLDPSYYDYGRTSENAFGEVTNAAGTMLLPGIAMATAQKLAAPILGAMPAIAAIKALPFEAVRTAIPNIALEAGVDSALGGLDQRDTAENAFKWSVGTNLLLRPLTYGLQRIPDIDNTQIRELIDLSDKLQKNMGDKFSLLKPSTYWQTGNNLRNGLAQRVRNESFGAEYNANLRSPWSRDVYGQFESDKKGFMAKWIKKTMFPGTEETAKNVKDVIDRDWLQNYREEAGRLMDATPQGNITIDGTEFFDRLDALKETYGSAIEDIPAFKKHLLSIGSVMEDNFNTLPDGSATTHMTPEFYRAKMTELDKAIAGLEKRSYGSQAHLALVDLKDFMLDQATSHDPAFAQTIKDGRTMYAGYNRLLKITDPFTGEVDFNKAQRFSKDQVAGRGIPITYDLEGEQRNLFNDVSDMAWYHNPKNLTSATLHDNQSAAAAGDSAETLGLAKRLKRKSLHGARGVLNVAGDDISSIPLRFSEMDPTFWTPMGRKHIGFSPTDINAYRNIIGSGVVAGNFKSDPEFMIENEQQLIEANKMYEDYMRSRNAK